MSSEEAPHVVFLNIKATGHVNPTLSIVAQLKSQGCHVTYFVDEDLRRFVEAAGATWQSFRCADSNLKGILENLDEAGIAKYVPPGTREERYHGLPHCSARNAELFLPALLEDLVDLKPKLAAIVYDPFLSFGRVAAHMLNVPAIAMLTMPGPASMAKPKDVQDTWESEPWVARPRQNLIDNYGFDIFAQGMPMEYYSPILNLVTTIEDLFMPPAAGHQQERFGNFPFKMVGLLAEPSVKRISNANISADGRAEDNEAEAVLLAVDQALQEGRQAIYISLGIVATSGYFYEKPFGHFGRDNGLTDVTGRELVQHVFRCCFEAFGHREDLVVALSLGQQDDVLDGLPPLPKNFIARKSLPQLQLLKRSSAFVTHAGANSMHESFGHSVPMVVVPMFGDQPINGDAIVKCGVGYSFRMPMQTLTPTSLQAAMKQLLEPSNSYCESARAMAEKLTEAGGSVVAVDSILQVLRDWEAPEARPRLLGRLGTLAKIQKAGTDMMDAAVARGV